MKVLDELCDVLEDELEDIVKSARNNGMSPDELVNAYKAVDIVKDITTIKAMKEAEYGGYSRDGYSGREYSNRMMPYYSYDDDYSMARGRGANAMRDSRGRYSRDDEKEHLMKEMENMKRQLEQMQR